MNSYQKEIKFIGQDNVEKIEFTLRVLGYEKIHYCLFIFLPNSKYKESFPMFMLSKNDFNMLKYLAHLFEKLSTIKENISPDLFEKILIEFGYTEVVE